MRPRSAEIADVEPTRIDENVGSAWPETIEIPRIANPTRAEVDAFIRAGEPVFFTGVIPEEYLEASSFDRLEADYGDVELVAYIDFPERDFFGPTPPAEDMTVREFIAWMNNPDRKLGGHAVHFPVQDEFAPDGIGWDKLHPELYAQQLWLQPEGTTVGMHLHRQAWVGGMYGRKNFICIHRRDTCKAMEPLALNPHHVKIDPRDPNFEKYPELEKIVPYVGTLNPGEVIYIPKFMWHFVWSIEPCVTAHGDFSNTITVPGHDPYDWAEFTRDLPKFFGAGLTLEVVRQFLWYGALKRPVPEAQHPYELPPWGAFVYDALVTGEVKESL